MTQAEAEPVTEQTGLEALTEMALLDTLAQQMDMAAWVARQIDVTKMEVERRMRDKGATMLAHPSFTEIALKSRAEYDQRCFDILEGLLTPEQLAKVRVPAHEEVVQVAARWNTTSVKALAKLGGEVKAVIEGARIEGPARLAITYKPKSDGPQ